MKNRMKVLRAEVGLTQGQLAERIGVSRQAVIAIEQGKYVPSTVLALKMAKEFRTTVEQIFMLDEED